MSRVPQATAGRASRAKRVPIPGAVTEQGLATLFGVDRRTVSRWVRAGLPARRSGRELGIEVTAAVAWVRARDAEAWQERLDAATSSPDIERARAQKLIAEARLMELKLDRERGDLVPTAAVEERWSAMLVALREAVMDVPGIAVQSGLIAATREAELATVCRDALLAFGQVPAE